MSDIDYLRQCPVCSEWRHVSWYDVGRRGCKACQLDEEISFELAKAQVQLEQAAIPATMIEIVREEIKPDGITASQWRMLHLIEMGYDELGIALATGLPSQDVPKRKREAMNALFREAERRAEQNLGIAD